MKNIRSMSKFSTVLTLIIAMLFGSVPNIGTYWNLPNGMEIVFAEEWELSDDDSPPDDLPPEEFPDYDNDDFDNIFNGNGSEWSPFLIESIEDFLYIADAISSGSHINGVPANFASYRLENNIYVLNAPMFYGIGSLAFPFAGNFNGNGFTVNLQINTTVENNVGLFRVIDGATIRNVTIEGTVTGNDNVGGISGLMQGASSVIDSTINATVTGRTNVGGIAGVIEAGSAIINANINSSSAIRGRDFLGGIAGRSTNSSVENSRVYGNVIAANLFSYNNYGGIVGVAAGNSRITYNEMWGDLQGGYYNVGGITGQATDTSVLESNTVYGNITGTYSYLLGSVAGNLSGTAVIRNSYSRNNQVHKYNGTTVFVGSVAFGTAIENSGYFVTGSVTPATAAVLINDQAAYMIERGENGGFAALVPVSKPTGTTTVTNNRRNRTCNIHTVGTQYRTIFKELSGIPRNRRIGYFYPYSQQPDDTWVYRPFRFGGDNLLLQNHSGGHRG
jgi:hypothetical protein